MSRFINDNSLTAMIQQNINRIKAEIGKATLIAVSKHRSIPELEELYATGHRIFAENRVQELLKKQAVLPQDIDWHLIGHLQSNKVKTIIDKVTLIHSVDSIKLLNEIEKQANKKGIKTSVLLQVHIAQEETKFGFQVDALFDLVQSGALNAYNSITFCGLMSMASLTEDQNQVVGEFKKTRDVFTKLMPIMPNPSSFKELSMGMSGDYLLAVQNGATMVRIGTRIFK